MPMRVHRARELALAALLTLVCCERVPVPLYVDNHTGETLEVRIAGSRGGWASIEPGATGSIGAFQYGGWCNVPERWVPDDFAGLEVRSQSGHRRDVTAERFVKDARFGRGWTLRLDRSAVAP